jgi:hypothetical protein
MRTATSGAAPARVLTVDHWSDLSGVEPAEAPALRRVVVFDPVRLDALDGYDFLRLVSLLRDLQSENIGVDWRLTDDGLPCNLADVSFLPPPTGEGSLARGWRQEHRFGTFYWRAGPGFVVIQDLRRSQDRKRLVLDAPEELTCFERHRQVAEQDHRAAARQCIDVLRAEGVLLGTSGPWLVALPMRMKQWAIPSTLI